MSYVIWPRGQVRAKGPMTTRANQSEDPKWKGQGKSMREKLVNQLGRHAYSRPWSSSGARTQGLPQASARIQELLDVAFLSQEAFVRQSLSWTTQSPLQSLDRKVIAKDLFCDVSQAINRKPWFSKCMRTLTTSSSIYSFELERVLLPHETMRLMGFPAEKLTQGAHQISDSQISEFVGQSMALPSCAASLSAVLASIFEHGCMEDLFSRSRIPHELTHEPHADGDSVSDKDKDMGEIAETNSEEDRVSGSISDQ